MCDHLVSVQKILIIDSGSKTVANSALEGVTAGQSPIFFKRTRTHLLMCYNKYNMILFYCTCRLHNTYLNTQCTNVFPSRVHDLCLEAQKSMERLVFTRGNLQAFKRINFHINTATETIAIPVDVGASPLYTAALAFSKKS